MQLLKILWLALTTLGPSAPSKEVAEPGPSTGRTLFGGDAGDDDDAGDEPAEPEADDAAEAEDEEPAGDDDEAEQPEASDDDEDEDEDEDASEDDEEDEDEEDDEDDDWDSGAALRQAVDARLASTSGPANPSLRLPDTVALRADARRRYQELRDKDDEGKYDADAIFEIALDAMLQGLGAYHEQVSAPAQDRVEKGLRNVDVARRLTTFRKKAGEALTPKIERRMAEVYTDFASRHGWRKADSVTLEDLFRMAGGRLRKGAKAKGKATGKAAAAPAATAQKKAALAAASGPRSIGRTTPTGGAGKRNRKDRVLQETIEHVAHTRPFFSLG